MSIAKRYYNLNFANDIFFIKFAVAIKAIKPKSYGMVKTCVKVCIRTICLEKESSILETFAKICFAFVFLSNKELLKII